MKKRENADFQANQAFMESSNAQNHKTIISNETTPKEFNTIKQRGENIAAK